MAECKNCGKNSLTVDGVCKRCGDISAYRRERSRRLKEARRRETAELLQAIPEHGIARAKLAQAWGLLDATGIDGLLARIERDGHLLCEDSRGVIAPFRVGS